MTSDLKSFLKFNELTQPVRVDLSDPAKDFLGVISLIRERNNGSLVEPFNAQAALFLREPLLMLERRIGLTRQKTYAATGGDYLQSPPVAVAQRLLSLDTLFTDELTRVRERPNYYSKMQWAFQMQGSEILWAQMIADISPLIANLLSNKSIQSYLQLSDQNLLTAFGCSRLIMRYAYERLEILLSEGPLAGQDALLADMVSIAEEQSLIQPLYETLTSGEVAAWQRVLSQSRGLKMVVPAIHWAIPPFKGNVLDFQARYNYGVDLLERYRREEISPDLRNQGLELADPSFLDRTKFKQFVQETSEAMKVLGVVH